MRVSHSTTQVLSVVTLVLCTACVSQRDAPPQVDDLPAQWPDDGAQAAIPASFLDSLQTPFVIDLVDEALNANHNLAQQAQQLEIARQRVAQLRADRLPSLSLSVGAQRARASGSTPIIEQVDLSANARVELDIWGRLSDAQRRARLDYLAAQARYTDSQRRLAARVSGAAFSLISAKQLLRVFKQRLQNLNEGLDIIEQGYRSGLNGALDVYLAQNNVEQQRANVANQQHEEFAASTALELLLSRYPGGVIASADQLPCLPPPPGLGMPIEILTRRPDIRQAWYELLGADAALAIAHKNRFPTLSLSGSVRDSDNAIDGLLDGGRLAFTAGASLITPLFQGGRLLSLERQARLRVSQAESFYLETVYAAFAEVENELNRASSLEQRYLAFIKARENAEAALNLAEDQYQRGLVPYTTVLESQRRAFDAQTTVVQLHNQQLQNRLALLVALGGDY